MQKDKVILKYMKKQLRDIDQLRLSSILKKKKRKNSKHIIRGIGKNFQN